MTMRRGEGKKVASRMKDEEEKYQITKAERASPPDMASTFKG